MLPQVLQSTTIPALAEVINFAQARQEVLAGNIANSTTPGYRTRDLSVGTFQARLKEMIDATYKRTPPPTSPGHVSPGHFSPGHVDVQEDRSLTEVRKTLTNVLYHDDTNIDLEKQVLEMNKNNMMHSLALTIMANQFQLMQVAISERV